jgi:anti-sigma factor RsiW
MTMHDEWTGRLSDYLDDELAPDERRGIERHLAGCEACATALDELKHVVERARSLPTRPPQTDLWNGIADRIGATGAAGRGGARIVPIRAREPWRISFTLPQLAAASLLLAMVSGGVAWRMHTLPAAVRTDGPGDSVQVRPPLELPADTAVLEQVSLADAQYDSAVADLQDALQKGRGHLDPATIRIVEQNLKIIDRAIDQARQAVMDDPGNSYLTSHLVETRRKKLDLLRRAAALASETN